MHLRGVLTLPLVKVKEKFQITLPAEIREQLRLAVGDLLEAVWKQSLYKRRPYVICRARLRTDLLNNRSLTMLLEISKRLIYWILVSGQPLSDNTFAKISHLERASGGS